MITPDGSLSISNFKITNLADATSNTDALNLQTANVLYYSNSTTLNAITVPSSNVSMNSHKITDLATPTLNNDAVTK
jgi:hypothetical protein